MSATPRETTTLRFPAGCDVQRVAMQSCTASAPLLASSAHTTGMVAVCWTTEQKPCTDIMHMTIRAEVSTRNVSLAHTHHRALASHTYHDQALSSRTSVHAVVSRMLRDSDPSIPLHDSMLNASHQCDAIECRRNELGDARRFRTMLLRWHRVA